MFSLAQTMGTLSLTHLLRVEFIYNSRNCEHLVRDESYGYL
ncbi:unnamed protein product [Acanthoscelides obtectus]|uniref:Uncharacterized protein n=1 Tax=Acanthoscelides obtectus TaxID=200917 RepID=A0A9P0MEK8_ACAOB|nr:unnamed protein product [Acanthoscelides obtectus]CAK1671142.1 hypothetical protein AOBTE_LOCUS28083 [Acanthoscelides obtectus]